MASVNVEIGRELGRFKSFEDWVNNAKHVYAEAYRAINSKDVLTLDSATPRRVLLRGLQFENARRDMTFPVVVYAIS